MKKCIFVIAAILTASASAQAHAASPFDGSYVGIQAGMDKRSINLDLDVVGVSSFSASDSKLGGGVYVGHDWNSNGNFVLGIELGVGTGSTSLSSRVATNATAYTDPKWQYDMTLRAGVPVGTSTLVYARAGYGSERLTVGAAVSGPIASMEEEAGWSSGVLFGGGIEVVPLKNISIRAEYRFRDMKGSYKGNQALLGIGYRF